MHKFFLAAVLALTATTGFAQAAPNLLDQKLGWCAGEWRAAGKGPDGKPMTVEVRTRWSENHRALVFDVAFVSETRRTQAYHGMYVWNPEKQAPVMYQVNDEGVLTEGEISWEGATQIQNNRGFSAPGMTFRSRTTLTRDGNDAYDWHAFFEKDGKFIEVLHLRYERVK